MSDDSKRVEPFDASYATENDPVYAPPPSAYSAHPNDPPIVPSRTPAEQAAIEAEREAARRRELARLQADPEVQALITALKDAPRDARGRVVPRNDGAYRVYETMDARIRELEAQGCPHDLATARAASEIAAASASPAQDEPTRFSPDDPRYLGSSIPALMGEGRGRGRVAPPKHASIAPDLTRLERGATSAKALREPCHACGYRNAVDSGVCQQCGANLLGHREPPRRGPAPSATSKRAMVTARVSRAAREGLGMGGNASSEIEAAGLAILSGQPFELVRRMSPAERARLREHLPLQSPSDMP